MLHSPEGGGRAAAVAGGEADGRARWEGNGRARDSVGRGRKQTNGVRGGEPPFSHGNGVWRMNLGAHSKLGALVGALLELCFCLNIHI